MSVMPMPAMILAMSLAAVSAPTPPSHLEVSLEPKICFVSVSITDTDGLVSSTGCAGCNCSTGASASC